MVNNSVRPAAANIRHPRGSEPELQQLERPSWLQGSAFPAPPSHVHSSPRATAGRSQLGGGGEAFSPNKNTNSDGKMAQQEYSRPWNARATERNSENGEGGGDLW